MFSVKQYIRIHGIVCMVMFLRLELLSDLAANIQPLQICEYNYVEVTAGHNNGHVSDNDSANRFVLFFVVWDQGWLEANTHMRILQTFVLYILIFRTRM